jgi:hypothetical protein
VSLNHIINEFQNLFGVKYFKQENRNALEITNKMNEKNYTPEQIAAVDDIFKRRNENSVSHANIPEIGLWSVHCDEYYKYKMSVFEIMSLVFNSKSE